MDGRRVTLFPSSVYSVLCFIPSEKSRQRRSRHFVVLTYWQYAPRVKMAVALLDDFFEHSRWLLISALLWTFLSYLNEIFNRPNDWIR